MTGHRTQRRRDSIAVRIAMTVVLVLVIAQLGSVGMFYLEGMPARAPFDQVLDEIADTARTVADAPASDQARLAAAAGGRSFQAVLEPAPTMGPADEHGPRFRFIRRRLATALGDPAWPVVIATHGPAEGWSWLRDALLGPGPLHLQVALHDGRWLHVTLADPVPRIPLLRFALRLGLFTLLVAGLSVLAARRLAAPILDFAEAADRLGVDTDAPPLAERGPRELRLAIQAFNRMQHRLVRFLDDRTKMIAAMSHDLRTPLTRLRLRAEFVDDPEQQRKMLADLDEMSAMIESTLAFARDDTKREPRTLVDLGRLAQSVCDDAADAGAAVTFAGSGGVDIRCRPAAVKRALANLVDNAVKYGGTARVTVHAEPGRAVVAVEDDGPGIPDDQQERVFQPFYRIEGSRNRDTGGVGLGLAVARTVARGHGGDISLSNRPGGGLTARLELPI